MPEQANRPIAMGSALAARTASFSRAPEIAGALLIAGLALLIYLPALNGEFILDDDVYLTSNSLIASPSGWYRFWLADQPMDYYPVSNASLWIEWRLWRENPTGYHITNLLLHVASALLIWTVLNKLAIPGAFFAALLYAVHPINAESVAWISQRKDLLAVVFALLSGLWYLRAQDRGATFGCWYRLSLLAFLLAMLSKGSVAFLPVVLLGLIWWRKRRIGLADLFATLPFFLIAVVLSVVNARVQTRGFSDTIRTAGLMERCEGAAAAVWFYVAKALVPINQVFVYPQWHVDTKQLLWWLPLIAAVTVTVLLVFLGGIRSTTWARSLLFAWGFFCVTLGPMLGFADVGFMRYSLVADHYLHFALIGVVALVAAGFETWRASLQSAGMAPPIVAAVLVAALSMLTWQQARLYGGPVPLYVKLLEKNPQCVIAHYNLANALLKNNQPQEAIRQYELTIQMDPSHSQAQANLGAALAAAGQLEEAIAQYQRALKLKPDNLDAVANMALAYAALGRSADAIAAAEQAVQLARAQDQTSLAEQIGSWLTNYRSHAGQSPKPEDR